MAVGPCCRVAEEEERLAMIRLSGAVAASSVFKSERIAFDLSLSKPREEKEAPEDLHLLCLSNSVNKETSVCLLDAKKVFMYI